MSKRHSERCESRSKNNLGKNSKGITATKSKLSTHDRLCTLVLTHVKTSVHDVTFSEWLWMQLIRINCLINQKIKDHDENNVSVFFIFLSICCYLLDN
jgi:hypothetical protein